MIFKLILRRIIYDKRIKLDDINVTNEIITGYIKMDTLQEFVEFVTKYELIYDAPDILSDFH